MVIFVQEEIFYDWISPKYLDILTQSDIQDRFEQASEIQLSDFLLVSTGIYIILDGLRLITDDISPA